MASVLDGKTLVALGDSLIHGSKLGPSATWVNKLAERHGMTVYNYGINGNSIALPETEEKHPPMCIRYADMADGADYVVLLGGANDKRLSIPLGDEERRNRETDAKISANDRMVQAKASAASAVQRMNAVQQATGFSQTSPADIAGEEEPDAGSFMSL